MAVAEISDISEIVRSLGLQNRRAEGLKRMSAEYVSELWKDVSELWMVGKYARDSWSIFQEGREDVDVEDVELSGYLESLKTKKKRPVIHR
jgi:hypothetical protein